MKRVRTKETPKEKVRVKTPPRVKGRTKATRAKVSPTRAPLVLQLSGANAGTAANTATSSVTVGSFMDAGDQKKVNQVESNASNNTAGSPRNF